MSAQAYPQIPIGLPPHDGCSVGPCPNAAPPKFGPQNPSTGFSGEPGHASPLTPAA